MGKSNPGGIVGLAGHGPPRELPPSELEEAMRQAWKEAGAQSERGVARACMLTLVGHAADPDQAEAVELALDGAAVAVPSRVILLVSDPKGPTTPKASFGTNLHVRPSGGQSVYSEEIHLRAGPGALAALPGLVWGLRMPDLPLVAYWPCSPPEAQHPLAPLLASVDRLVVDSRAADWPLPATERTQLLDLDWARHEGWRRALAGLFEGPHGEGWLAALDRIRVVEAPDAPGQAGAHLGAWLASRLGWQAGSALPGLPGERLWRLERRDGATGLLVLAEGAAGLGLGRVLEVELEGRDPKPFRVRVRAEAGGLRLEGVGPVALHVPLRPLPEAQLLGQLLQGHAGAQALLGALRLWAQLRAVAP